MRKVFLDDLPTKAFFGANKDKEVIDWLNSVGQKIKFVYDDIEGEIEIVDYISKGQKISIKYNENTFSTVTSLLSKCMLGSIVGAFTKEFKIQIGSVFEDEKRKLIITDRMYKKELHGKSTVDGKWYVYKCKICGYDGSMTESNLIKGNGCSCCCNPPKTVVLGINAIWDTDRWMCDIGVSEEDAKRYTRSSGKRIVVRCPDCGREKNITICKISARRSISCTCGDGFYYPEKFMYSVLKQLNVDFETQYSPDYLKPKRSDFYLPDYNLVVECDGGMNHLDGKVHGKSKKTLKEHIEIDNWKDNQYLKYGVKTIRIDCVESNMEYIKNNILNSELSKFIDLNEVNWLKCEEFALKNIVKEVCDYWNQKEERETICDLSKIFELNRCTIIKYLKKGGKLGWCNYDAKREMTKNKIRFSKMNVRPVEIFKDGISLGKFKSLNELSQNSEKLFNVRIYSSGISGVCRGISKTYKGFVFKYIK